MPDIKVAVLSADARQDTTVTTGTKAWELFKDQDDVIAARVGGELKDLSYELLDLARRQDDRGLLLQAHHAAWTVLQFQGEPVRCWEHHEQGLALYDPDRARTITYLGEIRPWPAFLGAVRAALTAQQAVKGAGIRILTETIGSPTLAAQPNKD